MTILVTGGTGKTGIPLSRLLKKANLSVLIASRSGTAPGGYKGVKFDWFDEKTFENPFKADSNIDRVYLVVPSVIDGSDVVKPFIDLAISKGVKRFVLLTATQIEIGSATLTGKVHEYLVNSKVDYAVLRPTWFMRKCLFNKKIPIRQNTERKNVFFFFIENFGTMFVQNIRDKNEIYSVAKDGRIPFVSVEDVAQAAVDALVSKKSPNKDYYIVGPELFTYDQASKTPDLDRKRQSYDR